jgi:hypothetical protein
MRNKHWSFGQHQFKTSRLQEKMGKKQFMMSKTLINQVFCITNLFWQKGMYLEICIYIFFGFFFFFLAVLEFEFRALFSQMLLHLNHESCPQSFFFFLLFSLFFRLSLTLWPASHHNPISTSQVARIIGICHHTELEKKNSELQIEPVLTEKWTIC